MKHPGTWIAIVDGQNARFVAHDAHGFHTLWSRGLYTAGSTAGTAARTPPGRSVANADTAKDKRRFAALVAAELNNAAARHLFVSLILAGPAFTVRWTEEALDGAVGGRIVGRLIRGVVPILDQDLPVYFPSWPQM